MKKSVVLADNSYTIRRIVELSFSEEEGIDLISFDTGLSLKEKILEIKPAVVLADIKLPEMNGYEICRFINETPELKDTKVFLIKGGFEPVDEAQLKDLTYVDFITKPFDSKALVTKIKDILSAEQAEIQKTQETEIPSSLPEDFPSIDDIGDVKEDISFSDLGDNIDADKFFESDSPSNVEGTIGDEVLPSEEITQGAGNEDGKDKLSPDNYEDIDNPFANDNSIDNLGEDISEEEKKIRENIKAQEEELNIGSLTMEEIDIQKEIDRANAQGVTDEGEETRGKSSIENIDESQLENVFSPPVKESTLQEQEPPLPQREETKKSVPDVTEQSLRDSGAPHTSDRKEEIEKVLSEIKSSEEVTQQNADAAPSTQEAATASSPVTDIPVTETETTAEPEKEKPIEASSAVPGKEEIMKSVEDKLTQSVKEILWEIVPPLAEKLIKEEINQIEKRLENELSPQEKS